MSPLGKASKLLVLDEINKKEETQPKLDFDQIVFGQPVNNPKTLEYDRNTELHVTSITSEIAGSTNVYYNRLDLQTLFSNSNIAEVELNRPEQFTSVLDLLPELNVTYGLAIDETDVLNTVPVEGDIQTLVARIGSYAWLGELRIKLLSEPEPGLDLSDIITQNILDGLNYPDADITGIVRPTGNMAALTGPLSSNGVFSIAPTVNADHTWQYTNGELRTAITVAGSGVSTAPDYKTYSISGSLIHIVGGMFIPLDTSNVQTLADMYIIEVFTRSTVGAENLKRMSLVSDGGVLQLVDSETREPVASNISVASSAQGTQFQFAIELAYPAVGSYQAGIVAYRRNSIVARVANIIDYNVGQ